jgi:hypothetical protein
MSFTRGRPTGKRGTRPDTAFERDALACLDSLYGAGLRLTAHPADAE